MEQEKYEKIKEKYKKILEDNLKKIDYSLKHKGCNFFGIYNHKGVYTGWELWDNTIGYRGRNQYQESEQTFSVYFKLGSCKFSILKGGNKIPNCLSIGENKKNIEQEIFVQFYNHDKMKEKK